MTVMALAVLAIILTASYMLSVAAQGGWILGDLVLVAGTVQWCLILDGYK